MNYLILIAFSFISWIGIGAYFYFAKDIARVPFIILHLLVVALSTGLVFFAYHKWFHDFSPFHVMAVALLSIFIFEFVTFYWLYPEGQKYLNFWDYLVPIFIGASTIYLIGVFLEK